MYDAIVQSMLPIPEHVNFSETGFSFFNERPIQEGTYVHVTLSHPENFFHIAATAQVAYSREENNKFRIGAYFITLHPQDRVKLSESIALSKPKDE